MVGVALTAVAIAASAPVHATTVYATGFESPDYATGQLSGQSGWNNATNAYVQTSTVESGSQAASVDSTTSGQHVTTQTVSYDSAGNPDQLVTISTDFQFTGVAALYWEALTALGNGGFINQILVNGVTGQVCGLNPCSGPVLTQNTWYNISMQLDYSTDIVTDFVNGVAFSSGAFDDIPALSTTLSIVGFGINSSGPGGAGTASWDNFSVATSEVPEPASWAIMLAGFAFLGLTGARRRKTTKTPLAI